MPEGYPKPPGITNEESAFHDGMCEGLYGPVVASYTPNVVTAGEHPQYVKDAWIGVRMPIREDNKRYIRDGCAWVDSGEAYNSLVASGASEEVLRYWVGTFLSEPTLMLGFNTDEGELEIVERHTLRVPLPVSYEPCPPDGFDLDAHERAALRKSEAGEVPF